MRLNTTGMISQMNQKVYLVENVMVIQWWFRKRFISTFRQPNIHQSMQNSENYQVVLAKPLIAAKEEILRGKYWNFSKDNVLNCIPSLVSHYTSITRTNFA